MLFAGSTSAKSAVGVLYLSYDLKLARPAWVVKAAGMETNWQIFPRSQSITPSLKGIVDAFVANESGFVTNSKQGKSKPNLESNEVLKVIAADLEKAGFKVETSKRDKIKRPVLFGRRGVPEKTFDVDAYHEGEGIILEVESGRGFTNNQFLKDFFSGCAMQGVNHIAIALRLRYGKTQHQDFDAACTYFDSIYASGRMTFPIKSLLVIGYPVKGDPDEEE